MLLLFRDATEPRDPRYAGTEKTPPRESVNEMRAGLDFSDVMGVVSRRPEAVQVEEKSAWVKLSAPNGNKLYISKRGVVRQIDLSGWGEGLPGTVPPQRDNGRVAAQLDLEAPDALGRLEDLLQEMVRAAPIPSQQGQRHESDNLEVVDESDAREAVSQQARGDITNKIQPLPSRRTRGTITPGDERPAQQRAQSNTPAVQVRKPAPATPRSRETRR